MKVFVETERLILREVLDIDVVGFFELDSDPEVHQYLGNKPIKTMADAQANVDYVRGQYIENGLGRWSVIDKATGEFIGWSGLKLEDLVRPDFDYYDIGYRFKRKFWGKGIATETARVALKYGFETMNLDKISGAAHFENIGSNKVLQKIGMKWTEDFVYEGLPHHWYSLTKEEWEAMG